jgi:arylsulfatase A-like enzyme
VAPLHLQRVPFWASAVALVALTLGSAPLLPTPEVASTVGVTTAAKPPSIVLILLDDFSTELLATMPNGMRMTREGASFTNSFVADSLCCVSRAALLTGQYPHVNRVFTNNANSYINPLGGWVAFKRYGNMSKSVNVALRTGGYYTGFMGKYLNGYDISTATGSNSAPEQPEGWDSWQPIFGGGYRQWGWWSSTNKSGKDVLSYRPVTYSDSDYSTNVLSDWATAFIASRERALRPYFLEIATHSTHSSVSGRAHPNDPIFPPAYYDRPGHAKKTGNCGLVRCTQMDVRKLAGFNDDRRDNTPIYPDGRTAKPWQPNELVIDATRENGRYVNRAQMAQSVDRLIGRVRAAVGPNTYVFFTSDNGFHLGQHRLLLGKSTPYTTDSKVPMVVVGPDVPPGDRSQIVGNVDLAPTFETIAGLTPRSDRTGMSFLPALGNPAATGNRYTFFEHTYSRTNPETDPDADTDIGGSSVTLPSYIAVRSHDTLLVKWDLDKSYAGTDYAYELYDYRTNAYERTNVYGKNRWKPWAQDLRTKIEQFATCAPEECRALATDQ